MKRNLIIFFPGMLFISLFLEGIQLFAVIEGGTAKAEWVKPEEPKSLDDAQRMKDEARKEIEKNKEQRDDIEKLRYQEARYELKTALIGEARSKAKEDPTFEDKAKNIIETQEKERQAIEDQITKLTEQLKKTYEKPFQPEQQTAQKVQDFKDNMTDDFKNVTERDFPVSQFIDDHFYFAKTIREQGLPDYQSQKEALKSLQDFLAKNATKEVFAKLSEEEKNTYQQTEKDIALRIQEINNFINNPPQKIAGNDVATKLNLASKIPSDQIADVRAEITNVLRDEKLSQEEKIKNITEAMQTFEVYKLAEKAPDLFQFYKDTVENLKTKKEEPTEKPSSGFNEVLSKALDIGPEKMGDLVGIVVEKTGDVLAYTGEVASDFIIKKIKENPEYMAPVYEKVAEAGKGLSETAEKYGKKLAKVPDLVGPAYYAADAMNIAPSFAEPAVKYVAGETGLKIIKGLSYLPGWIRKPLLEKVVSPVAVKLAEGAKSLGELGKEIAKGVNEGRINIEDTDAKMKLARAREFIEKERTNYLTPEKRSRFAEVFKPVSDFFSSVKNWIKDQITTIKFRNAVDNYNTARSEYLTTLGLDENAISEQIKTKLAEVRKYPALRDELLKKDQKLAKATYELAQVYKTYADKLDGAFTNMEFMVKAWDNVYYDPKAKQDLVGLINNIADLRDQRLEYLNAMRQGINSIKKDLNDAIQGTGGQELNNLFTQRIESMLNGQMIKTIQDNQEVINAIDNALKQQVGGDSTGLLPN
jgi:hypothetical protein